MPHVITSGCCADASCVAVCPVDCIHPTPDEPDFGRTPTLYVDPRTCIDCGACVDACPVEAIAPADKLPPSQQVFTIRNREHYAISEPAVAADADGAAVAPDRAPTPLRFPAAPAPGQPRLDVVVVGTGPAAHYTADLLLRIAGAEVTMIDRLPVTGGLLRHGVAPDHPSTRRLADRFTGFLHNPRLHLVLGVDVGRDVTVDDLARDADAVVLAVGASHGRRLGVPGEDLPGSVTSTQFVNWYNAHPDRETSAPELSAERAVVVGTGNVALDVARILLTAPEDLARTDIADDALAALRDSRVREVVVVGRRGPDAAACTPGELHDLQHVPGVEVVVADTPGVRAQLAQAVPGTPASWFADLPRVTVDPDRPPATGRRVVFWFGAAPAALAGEGRVERVCLTRTAPDDGDAVDLTAGLVVTAIGHLGRPVPGVAFDETTHTIPHRAGRVLTTPGGEPVPGRYVVGWIKRGASGGIGANRSDAAETVTSLLADATAGALPPRRGSGRALRRRLRRQVPGTVDRAGYRAIDRQEREAGAASGRPRVRFTTVEQLRAAATRR